MSKIFQINNTITLVPSITAPTIVEALDNVTGLIPVRVAAVGITVECRLGAARLGTDWVSIEIRTAGTIPGPWSLLVPPRQISTAAFPVPPPIFNIFVPGGAGGFENGVYELRNLQYRNGPAGPGAALDESFPAPFRVDTIAPYATLSIPFQPLVPVLVNAPPGTVIDNDFLTTQGGLEIAIPDNTFLPVAGAWEAGDILEFYWSPVMDPRPKFFVGSQPMLQTGNTFFLLAADIVLSGLYYFFYTIIDRAGNPSRPSFNEFRDVSLLDDPVLEAPFLPLAPAPEGGSTDNLIDIKDYMQGVDVWIETYTNPAPLVDRGEVQWEAELYGPQQGPIATFPEVFRNMNDAIKASYTQVKGPQPVSVRYRIDRGGIFFYSPDKDILLDLSVEGPTLPGTLEPGDDNPLLNPIHLFGAVSDEEDVLREVDANLPVRAEIILWNVPELPAPGLDITVLYGTTEERVGPFPIGTTAPGTLLTFDIPWDVVARHGNGPQIVRYVVTGPGTTNENRSGPTTVNVIDAVSVILNPVQFLRAVDPALNVLDCSSLRQRGAGTPPVLYAEIFMPGDPRLAGGSVVTLTLTLLGVHPEFPPGPFTQDFPHTLSDDEATNGYTFQIDYRPFLALVVVGTIEASYTVPVAGGATGRGTPVDGIVIWNPATYCDGVVIPTP
ncbi:hypothetical protein CEC48_11660 [Pseudomonas sp. K2I15]|nr:hypothetical protein CEC48_11660 [Pseudomonas sp. K2I15]